MKPESISIPRSARAFTLIELIAVIVVLAVLAGVALPRYFSYRDAALEAADAGALGGIAAAFNHAHLYHRMMDSPSSQWITSLTDIASAMETGMLPTGLMIQGELLYDQRGNAYFLIAETATTPARLVPYTDGGGGSDGDGGGDGGKSSKAKGGDDNPGKGG